MAASDNPDYGSMRSRLQDEGFGKKTYGLLSKFMSQSTSAFKEGLKEQEKLNDRLNDYLSKSARTDKETLRIFEENFQGLQKLATEGNKQAEEFVKFYESNGERTNSLLDKLNAGEKLTEDQLKEVSRNMAQMTISVQESGKSLDLNFNNLAKSTLERLRDEKLSMEERRESIKIFREVLNNQLKQKNLSEKGVALFDDIKKLNLESKDLNKENLDALADSINKNANENSSLIVEKVAAPLKDIREKTKVKVTTAEESFKRAETVYEKTKPSGSKEDKLYNKKLGATEFVLSQFGLGGVGIGEFLLDKERRQGALKKAGQFAGSINQFRKAPVQKTKAAITEQFEFFAHVKRDIKNITQGTTNLITKLTGKLGNLMESTFEGISEGFESFWKKGSKIMSKGVSFIWDLLKGAGTFLLGGLKGGGSLLGKGISGAGKLIGKGISAIGGLFGMGGAVGTGEIAGEAASKGGSLLGKIGGKLGGAGKFLGKAGRFLGKAALPLALLSSGYDFYKGFTDPNEIAGAKPGEKLGFGKKFQAGTASLLSGLTFGLVDPKTMFDGIQKGIDFLFGKDGILTKTADFFKSVWDSISVDSIKSFLGKVTDSIMNFFNADKIKSAIDGIIKNSKDIISGDNILGGIKGLIMSMFDAIKEIFLNFTPGGKLASSAVEYFKNMFSESGKTSSPDINTTTPGNAPIIPASPTQTAPTQKSTVTPVGSSIDSTSAKQVATKDIINQASSKQENTSSAAPSPVNVNAGGSKKTNVRMTHVDDLSIATLNSLLFE